MTTLRTAREARKLTLKAAALAVDTDPGNLSRIERGAQSPSLELAQRIAAFYDIPVVSVLYPKAPEAPAA